MVASRDWIETFNLVFHKNWEARIVHFGSPIKSSAEYGAKRGHSTGGAWGKRAPFPLLSSSNEGWWIWNAYYGPTGSTQKQYKTRWCSTIKWNRRQNADCMTLFSEHLLILREGRSSAARLCFALLRKRPAPEKFFSFGSFFGAFSVHYWDPKWAEH